MGKVDIDYRTGPGEIHVYDDGSVLVMCEPISFDALPDLCRPETPEEYRLVVDWGPGSHDLITECGHCAEERPCIKRCDPFIAEVYPEELGEAEETYWCYNCFCDRKDRI